ncbi:Alpha/Beta hydrolase protein [Bombardia bombarda]|uniref:Carboxylic ester hydrolase n=1 Tax=Bombardia bombarda TaxID=252184 RepID=A0AA40C4K9_9PEZI|nr:Alpha/Beta hydrolase protein [Bombardia bombarda]
MANAFLVAISFLQSPVPAAAVDPTVNLSYSQYIGTPLINGITQWLGMRYAAPPVGDLRFEPPRDPRYHGTPQKADTANCLTLSVFAPSNASSHTNTNKLLPVFVFLGGGGFASLASANLNASGLIAAAHHAIVVVTPNYRVGPYGFISSEAAPHVTANNGLRDQRKALQWVQRHIAKFGGDPRRVVLGGDSAGAASVVLQMGAFGGDDGDGDGDGLFHAVAGESVSFATMLTVKEAQYQFDNLVIRTGCAGGDGGRVLACLRGRSAEEIGRHSGPTPYPFGGVYPPVYMWNPVVDGDFVPELTYSAFGKGRFVRGIRAAVFGDDTNGGTLFVPRGVGTKGEGNGFLRDQFPWLTVGMLERLNGLYPNPDASKGYGCWYRQTAAVYGEMRYMCPSLFITQALRRHGLANSSYAYRWNVKDPEQVAAGVGVPHVVELNALFGPYNIPGGQNVSSGAVPRSYYPDGINAHAVPVIQGYWASFIRSFNPNEHRCCGAAKWTPWRVGGKNLAGKRLLFDTGGRTEMEKLEGGSMNIKGGGVDTLDGDGEGQWDDDDGGLLKRCEYLWSIGAAIHQ